MKEPYGEGLASHTDPESCVDSREAGREALTGAHAGGVLSREMIGNQDANAVLPAGRQHRWERNRERPLDPARSKTPSMHGTSTRENREALPVPTTRTVSGPVWRRR
jgi:hypothetical protein